MTISPDVTQIKLKILEGYLYRQQGVRANQYFQFHSAEERQQLCQCVDFYEYPKTASFLQHYLKTQPDAHDNFSEVIKSHLNISLNLSSTVCQTLFFNLLRTANHQVLTELSKTPSFQEYSPYLISQIIQQCTDNDGFDILGKSLQYELPLGRQQISMQVFNQLKKNNFVKVEDLLRFTFCYDEFYESRKYLFQIYKNSSYKKQLFSGLPINVDELEGYTILNLS